MGAIRFSSSTYPINRPELRRNCVRYIRKGEGCHLWRIVSRCDMLSRDSPPREGNAWPPAERALIRRALWIFRNITALGVSLQRLGRNGCLVCAQAGRTRSQSSSDCPARETACRPACYGGLTGKAVYCGVKSFDLCCGEALWAELRHQGVDVLNLVLDQTDTPAHRQILEQLGLPIPQSMAAADDVAELGLARLGQGPVCNWGSSDEELGFAPTSPAHRRSRILAIEETSKAYTRQK
jgi:hypothetical protein